MCAFLRQNGFDARPFNHPGLAFVEAATQKPDIIVTDLCMAQDGFEVIDEMKKIVPKAKIVVVTGDRSREEEAKSHPVDLYLDKPIDPNIFLKYLLTII